MGELGAGLLATLAAEIRAELPLIDRTAGEITAIGFEGAASDAHERVRLYAIAALLDTFYTAIERLLERIARPFGAVPSGPHWHSELLAAAALDVPRLRPAVLTTSAVSALRRYLAFRHRFRNLYLFDLDALQVAPLASGASIAWALVRADLVVFADTLDRMVLELAP